MTSQSEPKRMLGQEGNNYHLESYFARLGEENIIVTQAWQAVLEKSVNSTTSNWLGWDQLFTIRRTKMLDSEDFVDQNVYLKNSTSLKTFVSHNMKPEPQDKNRPGQTQEYTPESWVTEIVRCSVRPGVP